MGNLWRRHRLVLALASLLQVVAVSTARAQDQAGSITAVAGSATLERAGRQADAAIGMPVRVHDRLQTAADSSLTVTLLSGDELLLSESSSIAIDQYAAARGDSSIDLLVGHLRSIISASLLRGRPAFEVHTPNAVAGVRGTDFETAFIEGKPCPGFPSCLRYTDVGVYRGIVEVSNPTSPGAPPVRVTQGYETTVPCELPPSSPAPLGMGELGGPGYH